MSQSLSFSRIRFKRSRCFLSARSGPFEIFGFVCFVFRSLLTTLFWFNTNPYIYQQLRKSLRVNKEINKESLRKNKKMEQIFNVTILNHYIGESDGTPRTKTIRCILKCPRPCRKKARTAFTFITAPSINPSQDPRWILGH